MNEFEFKPEPRENDGASRLTHLLGGPVQKPIVGFWVMGKFWIGMTKRPRWLTRQAMRLVFECRWFEGPVVGEDE